MDRTFLAGRNATIPHVLVVAAIVSLGLPASSIAGNPAGQSGGEWKTIATGLSHTCAIQAEGGQLFCWGYNGTGQLGDATLVNRASPTRIGNAAWTAVTVGPSHTCGIQAADQGLYCWGYNRLGELGDGTRVNRLQPTRIGSEKWSAIVSSSLHKCGLTTSHELRCWGSNGDGQLGDGTNQERSVPTAIGRDAWSAVTVGALHTCAISRADSRIHCWGANNQGQLGDGTHSDSNTPKAVGDQKWIAVAAGTAHTCGIDTEQRLWCWGKNANGELGDGTEVSKSVPTRIGTAIWSSVSPGSQHTCGVTTDGALECWGWNFKGELGDASISMRGSAVPRRIGGERWSVVSAGDSYTCGAPSTGRDLRCWGRNDYGQLGDAAMAQPPQPLTTAPVAAAETAPETRETGDSRTPPATVAPATRATAAPSARTLAETARRWGVDFLRTRACRDAKAGNDVKGFGRSFEYQAPRKGTLMSVLAIAAQIARLACVNDVSSLGNVNFYCGTVVGLLGFGTGPIGEERSKLADFVSRFGATTAEERAMLVRAVIAQFVACGRKDDLRRLGAVLYQGLAEYERLWSPLGLAKCRAACDPRAQPDWGMVGEYDSASERFVRPSTATCFGGCTPEFEEAPALIKFLHRRVLQGISIDEMRAWADLLPLPVVQAGAEVHRPASPLRWLRCAVGQTWDGKACVGIARSLDWKEAASSCPAGYRLPTAQEFGTLLACTNESGTSDRDARTCRPCPEAGACHGLFGQDTGQYWSLSPVVSYFLPADVSFETGRFSRAEFSMPYSSHAVRCVRWDPDGR